MFTILGRIERQTFATALEHEIHVHRFRPEVGLLNVHSVLHRQFACEFVNQSLHYFGAQSWK